MHLGGVYVCMADASVRFISDLIDVGDDARTAQPIAYYWGTALLGTWERLNASGDGLDVIDQKLNVSY